MQRLKHQAEAGNNCQLKNQFLINISNKEIGLTFLAVNMYYGALCSQIESDTQSQAEMSNTDNFFSCHRCT